MKTCEPWPYHLADVRFFDFKIEIGRKGVFDFYRNNRLKQIRKFKYGRNDKEKIKSVIDYLSNILIKIRKYEAPLRPAIFTRASYS